jgi:Domain of unknown function (DUF222)
MSALRSALEELVNEDLDGVDVDRLGDDMVEIDAVSGLLEAELTRRLAAFAYRGGPDRHGFPSATAWLKHHSRMAAGRAHRLVANSRLLDTAAATFGAWTTGRISSDQAHRLLQTANTVPAEYPEAEERLIGIVEDLGVTDTRVALEYWRQSVDGPGTILDEQLQEEARGVSLSTTVGGMARLDGWLTPLAGQALGTALDALMPPPQPNDTRTPRQRRHDALDDLARNYLDSGSTPTVGGEKPHLNLLCDLAAMQGIAGGTHQTETGQILTVDQIRKLACDSSVSRIVLGPDSEIIDVGRRTRVIPAALRRAIIIRDQHCTWKGGCDRDPRWCDVHHDQHWANGGDTNLDNCRLLCRYHHTLTHQMEYTGERPQKRGGQKRWGQWRLSAQKYTPPALAGFRSPELIRRD